MGDAVPPEKLTVAVLRAQLQARGLSTDGLKPVLVARLTQALSETAAAAQDGASDMAVDAPLDAVPAPEAAAAAPAAAASEVVPAPEVAAAAPAAAAEEAVAAPAAAAPSPAAAAAAVADAPPVRPAELPAVPVARAPVRVRLAARVHARCCAPCNPKPSSRAARAPSCLPAHLQAPKAAAAAPRNAAGGISAAANGGGGMTVREVSLLTRPRASLAAPANAWHAPRSCCRTG
jgi:hypothetical protein